MKAGYWPKTPAKRQAWMLEEMGEVLQAIGKIERFGSKAINPDTGKQNVEDLINELTDLRKAIAAVEGDLVAKYRIRL